MVIYYRIFAIKQMDVMKKILCAIVLFAGLSAISLSQDLNRVKEPDMLRELHRNEILIPDIPGYKTLKGDFHMHTIFSDGEVWPSVRVQEAYIEGLDVVAITEHIEHRPHLDYLTGDHNTAYEIAAPSAERHNILLVRSAEISRSMPPGHLNALFLEDANKLDTEDYMDAIEEANRQGGFLFWAHPGWLAQQPDTNKWWPIHEELVQRGWLHGVEVYNWDEWYPIAFGWCNDKNLAYIANTDAHMVAAYRFNLARYHRPMTLVFAEERTVESIRDAMFARRTAAFFLNNLAGPEHLLRELFDASVEVREPFMVSEKGVARLELANPTDLTFILENSSPLNDSPQKITLRPRSSVIITCNIADGEVRLPYSVANLHTGMEENLEVELAIPALAH